MIFKSVVLPHPDGPTKQMNSPCRTSTLTRSKTAIDWSGREPRNVIHRFFTTTASASRPCDRSIMVDAIGPFHRLQPFRLTHQQVEEPTNGADQHHARHHEVIAL